MTPRRNDVATHDRGGVLVEFALVIPILVAIILGGLTLGMSYNVNNTLNNSARETARFAATWPVDAGMNAWLNEVADVAIRASSGELDPTASGQELCVAYVHPDGTEPDDRTTALLEVAGSRTIAANTTCFNDGRPNGEARIQVQLQRDSAVDAIVFSTNIDLEATSVSRYERNR